MSFDMISVENLPTALLAACGSETASPLDDMIVSTSKIPRLSIQGRQFTECGVDGWKMTIKSFEYPLVILGIAPKGKNCSKAFFVNPFDDASEGVLPDCYSHDGIKPDSGVESPVHDNCTKCPYAAFGSAIKSVDPRTGAVEYGKGKRCAESKALFFMKAVPSTTFPGKWDADLEGDIWQLRVPVTSLKSMSDWARELRRLNINEPAAVVTKLEFLDGVSHPQLVFSGAGYMPDDQMIASIARSKSDDVLELVERGEALEVQGVVAPAVEAPALAQQPVVQQPVVQQPVVQQPVVQQPVVQQPVVQQPVVQQPVVQQPVVQQPVVQQPVVQQPVVQQPVAASAVLDAAGVPWDARIHSSSKALVAAGTWRRRNRTPDDVFNAVMAELRGAAPVQQPVQHPVQQPVQQGVFEEYAASQQQAPVPAVQPVTVTPQAPVAATSDDLEDLLSDLGL